MSALVIRVLDELVVSRNGEPIALPASRKTRALLAYLVLTARPHRRDRLCELFWETSDDPRGALRWSLSKLRRVVNEPGTERLAADRERVVFVDDDVEVDLRSLTLALEDETSSPTARFDTLDALRRPLLDGSDMPDQITYQSWLLAERREHEKLLVRAARRLWSDARATPEQALHGARVHAETRPYEPRAALALVRALQRAGERDEAQALVPTLAARFRDAGIEWPPEEAAVDAFGVAGAKEDAGRNVSAGTPSVPLVRADDEFRCARRRDGHLVRRRRRGELRGCPPAPVAPDDPLLLGRRRRAHRLRDRRRRAAAGEGGELAQPPRARLGCPDLESAVPRAGP